MGSTDKICSQTEPENPTGSTIRLSDTSRKWVEWDLGPGYDEYEYSFELNEAFRAVKSPTEKVLLLFVYAPDGDLPGAEEDMIIVSLQSDDEIFCAMEEYKEYGEITGSIDLVPLEGMFLFKAKMEYGGDMMYFYGFDRCGGYWENNGLCLIYPKSLAGTSDERRLMAVLDEAAESYKESVINKETP